MMKLIIPNEDEDNFRKFLSQGKNTVRDEIEEDNEVAPYIEDELQKFIISEEDEYQNSKVKTNNLVKK